jgi:hypothetical protein
MSGRVRDFILLVQNNIELLTEISKLDNYSISQQNLFSLTTHLYSNLTDIQVTNKIDTLCETKPFPILDFHESDDEFTLASRVGDLILWLSNNLHLASHRIILAIIEDMSAAIEAVGNILNSTEINLYLLKKHMTTLRRSNTRLSECASENLFSIGTQIQEFKEELIDYETKQVKARFLLDEYLDPMRDIIDPEGPMVSTIENAEQKLLQIESSITINKEIRDESKRIVQELLRNKKNTREVHWNALSQLQPILAPYTRPPSDLVKGASRALSDINKHGSKSIKLWKHFKLVRSTGPSFLLGEDQIQSWFQRIRDIQKEDIRVNISTKINTEYRENIPILSETNRLKLSMPISDLLEFILDNFPSHTLTECSSAAIDILVQFGSFESIHLGELQTYSRENQVLEAAEIAIK